MQGAERFGGKLAGVVQAEAGRGDRPEQMLAVVGADRDVDTAGGVVVPPLISQAFPDWSLVHGIISSE
jgi:hypothetical protein